MHKQIEALFLELTNVQKTLIDEKDKVQSLLEEKQLLIAEKAELSAQAQQQTEKAKPWWRFW